jgi:hypothetical protein
MRFLVVDVGARRHAVLEQTVTAERFLVQHDGAQLAPAHGPIEFAEIDVRALVIDLQGVRRTASADRRGVLAARVHAATRDGQGHQRSTPC